MPGPLALVLKTQEVLSASVPRAQFLRANAVLSCNARQGTCSAAQGTHKSAATPGSSTGCEVEPPRCKAQAVVLGGPSTFHGPTHLW